MCFSSMKNTGAYLDWQWHFHAVLEHNVTFKVDPAKEYSDHSRSDSRETTKLEQ